jgi:hypothetical protein
LERLRNKGLVRLARAYQSGHSVGKLTIFGVNCGCRSGGCPSIKSVFRCLPCVVSDLTCARGPAISRNEAKKATASGNESSGGIERGPPDPELIRQMLLYHLKGRLTSAELDIESFAQRIAGSGYSASDLKLMVDEAA